MTKERYVDHLSIAHQKNKAESLDAFFQLAHEIFKRLEFEKPNAKKSELLREALALTEKEFSLSKK